MKNPQRDIANLMKNILGTDVKIKTTEDQFLKQAKKLFCKFVQHVDKFEATSQKVLKDHSLDVDPFVEDLYVAIDYLVMFSFDDSVAEIVQHYLYGRDENGSVKYNFEGKEMIINTPEKLFDFMVMLGQRLADEEEEGGIS